MRDCQYLTSYITDVLLAIEQPGDSYIKMCVNLVCGDFFLNARVNFFKMTIVDMVLHISYVA